MSFHVSSQQPAYPVTTLTTTNTATATTTTTTISAASTPPVLATRPVGWHAKTLGFCWEKRSDQHRYRLQTGLPEVHAAIINNDWDTAAELLCPEDIGLVWLPATSQRESANEGKHTENGGWASALPSKDPSARMVAIRQMMIDLAAKTTVDDSGCLYGANLLTLCLQKSAPPIFMQSLMTLITRHAPRYINLPDANGRTPLYVAVERDDNEQVRLLLEAGANPLAECKFPTQANQSTFNRNDKDNLWTMSAYKYALSSGSTKIFNRLIENIIKFSGWNDDYPIAADPLLLEQWVSQHAEEEVRELARQFPCLKSFLFNMNDQSGSSIVCRTLVQGKQLDQDITPLFKKDLSLGAIYAAALTGNSTIFITQLNKYLEKYKKHPYPGGIITEELIKHFLLHCTPEDIPILFEKSEYSKSHIENLISSDFPVKELTFEKFCSLTKAVHAQFKNEGLNQILPFTAEADERYLSFVINLPGFTMSRDIYFTRSMYVRAAQAGNETAFEFAAVHSVEFDRLLEELAAGSSVRNPRANDVLVIRTLQARSLSWFEKYIAAGINLQPLIDSDGELVLPLMADLSPEQLNHWLRGLTFEITDQMINLAKTDTGRAALIQLSETQRVSS